MPDYNSISAAKVDMPTRREVVASGLLTVIWSSIPCLCSAQAPRQRHTFGCVLADDEAEQYLATSTTQQLFTTGNEVIIASSGNREFDYALAQNLSHVTDVFQVLPGFAFYDDFDGPNAFATPIKKMARADGTVLYGKRFLQKGLSERESPDAVVAAVCAHEFGHILQYKLGIEKPLRAGQPSVKRLELHADFLAGYFAGIRKLKNPKFPSAVFATSQYAIGDGFINNPNHHGTPEERAAAVVRGFETGYRERRSIGDAVEIGIKFVSA